MSNELANLRVTLSFPAPGGGTTGPNALSVLAQYKASVSGKIDVPAGTDPATVLEVPFGSVDTAATLVMVKNTSGYPVIVRFNSDTADDAFELEDGGLFFCGSATAPDGTPITALFLVTTAEQVAAGQISYWVFGDPE